PAARVDLGCAAGHPRLRARGLGLRDKGAAIIDKRGLEAGPPNVARKYQTQRHCLPNETPRIRADQGAFGKRYRAGCNARIRKRTALAITLSRCAPRPAAT